MIRHILADGREVDSIEGHVVPTSGSTASVYKLILDISKRQVNGGTVSCKEKTNPSLT